jgi:very-short-patch-repair endonuclease
MGRLACVPEALRYGPFRGSTAIARGLLTAAQLRGPTWRRLFHDIYVHREVTDSHDLHVRAALLHLPQGSVVTGRSAAHLWGAGLADGGNPVEVATVQHVRPHERLVIRRTSIPDDEVTRLRGVRLTKPLHTAWEIARTTTAIDAIGWLDALARAKRLDTIDLISHARRHFGARGAQQAATTLALVDRRAESPPESRLRLHIRAAGLPVPHPQWNVYARDGAFVARVDLGWPEFRFAVEYDGRWHADPAQLGRDRARIRTLNAVGWYVYPVTARDLDDVPRLMRHLTRVFAVQVGL